MKLTIEENSRNYACSILAVKTKERLAENYCNKIYQEDSNLLCAPDVYQSKKDFIAGFSAKEKIIKDKINGLKSKLKHETLFKLTKTYNIERIEKLKNQIEVLEQLTEKAPN